MIDIKDILTLMNAVYAAMLPAYKGREKQLELFLINASNDKLKELAKQLNI